MRKISSILLIDDNIHDNYFHELAIKKTDDSLIINSATSGEKAIEYLENSKKDPDNYPVPDLIFLDINMPGMNGFEFLEKAREKKIFDSSNPHIFVMLTSSLNPNDERMAKEQFANEIKEFKNKPLTANMLKEILEKYFK